jgi:hypothetical protein
LKVPQDKLALVRAGVIWNEYGHDAFRLPGVEEVLAPAIILILT